MESTETTYAQREIRKRISEKRELKESFQDYSEHSILLRRSEYGDYSHGDYSDYCRVH